MWRHVVVEGDDSARHQNFLRQTQIIERVFNSMAGIYREKLHPFFTKQVDRRCSRKARRVALDNFECVALRRHQSFDVGTERRQRPAAGTVHIETLLIKHVNGKTYLVVMSQGIQQKQKPPVMHAKLCDIAVHTVCVEDGADHVYNLPHPVAEPSLDLAVDVCVEMFQTLLTRSVHGELSVLIASGSTM